MRKHGHLEIAKYGDPRRSYFYFCPKSPVNSPKSAQLSLSLGSVTESSAIHHSERHTVPENRLRLAPQRMSWKSIVCVDPAEFALGAVRDRAPEIMRPQRYLPDAVSMVSIGLHINEAVCDLISRSVATRKIPPSYHSYQVFTLGRINPQLDLLAYLGAKFLELRGYKAYPFPANVARILKPTEEYPGGPGDISHKHVAVACGLGDIGWHNLLITPKYGVRQKLTAIVTNVPLEPDPILWRKMCDPESCGFQCAFACPTNAIPKDIERKISIKIGSKVVEYGKIEGWRCWGGAVEC